MFNELLRKLTADYPEAEYERYLWCEELGTCIDMDANKDKWFYSKRLNYKSFDEVAADLMKVSDDTGYGYEFLCDMFHDSIMDGNSAEEAMESVAGISYERDW